MKFSNEAIVQEQGDVFKVLSGFKELQDVSGSGRRRPWKEMKMGSLKLASLYERANEVLPVITQWRLEDLKGCGETLEFALLSNGRRELRRAWFCRVRLCPMCMWRRSLKLAARMKKAVESVKAARPSVRFLFVTFTQKNCVGLELGSVLSQMSSSFSKVLKNKRLAKVVLGYMRSIEVTVNREDWTCHPHIHAVLAVRADYFTGRNYLQHDGWRELWQSVMGLDYLPQVNVKVLKDSDWSAVEAAKYSVKAIDTLADSPDEDSAVRMLVDLTVGLHKRRLVTFGGVFRCVKFREEYGSGDLVHVEGSGGISEVGRVVYRWSPVYGVYVADERLSLSDKNR